MRTGIRAGALAALATVVLATMASAEVAGLGEVYVANSGSNTVSVLDPAAGSVRGTISVGAAPTGVVFTPDGTRAYISNAESDNVSVVDTATGSTLATVAVGDGPAGVAATSDGKHVYVTNSQSGTLSVIDTTSNTVAATITVGGQPRSVAVTPDGTGAVVVPGPMVPDSSPQGFHHTISLVDTVTNTAIAYGNIPPRNIPWDVAIAPDATRAYIAVAAATPPFFGGLLLFDLNSLSTSWWCTTDAERQRLVCMDDVLQVALSADGQRAFVFRGAFVSPRRIEIIDIATNTILGTVLFSGSVFHSARDSELAVSQDGTRAYVSNPVSDSVFVVDLVALSVVAEVPVGDNPRGLAIQPPRRSTTGETAALPDTKDDCKDGGYQTFGFKNQGDCVSFVASRSNSGSAKKASKS